MKKIIFLLLVFFLLIGVAYAQFGSAPWGVGPCAYGIGPFGECNPAPGGSTHSDSLKTESNDYILLESGTSDTLLLE